MSILRLKLKLGYNIEFSCTSFPVFGMTYKIIVVSAVWRCGHKQYNIQKIANVVERLCLVG